MLAWKEKWCEDYTEGGVFIVENEPVLLKDGNGENGSFLSSQQISIDFFLTELQ